MIGVIVNVVTVIVGSIIGLLAKKHIKEEMSKAVMLVMGLFSIFLGIKGALVGKETIVVLISLVVGTVIGMAINIDKYICMFGEFLKSKFASGDNDSNNKFVEAFVSSSILMCVGAMTIMGTLEAGLAHEYNLLFLKSIMDGITAIMLTTSMGIGVGFAAITILVVEGTLVMFAGLFQFLAENEAMLNEMISTGFILIIGIGLNLLGVTKLKIANMVPAIILAPIIFYLATLIGLV